MSGALQALFQNWRTFAPLVVSRYLFVGGNNSGGQLGQSDTISRSSPVQVGALTTWNNISTSAAHSVSIKTDGTLWTWGSGTDGCLGSSDTISRSSPVQVGALTTWNNISTNDDGGVFNVAVKTDGTLWAWGNNTGLYGGALGDGTTISRSSPVQVGALTTWSKIVAGKMNHVLSIKTDGTLWAWGGGVFTNPGLGQGNLISRSSPVQVGALTTWLNIAAGYYTGGAIKTDGTLWTWGNQSFAGALGDSGIDRSSPVQVGALTTWSKISMGKYHSMAIKTDGTLWTWGYNINGQLGLGDTTNRSSPVQVGILTNWSSVSCGLTHNTAIKTDGTLWTWGLNSSGQLLLGDTISRSSPVQVGALTTWLNIAAGGSRIMAISS